MSQRLALYRNVECMMFRNLTGIWSLQIICILLVHYVVTYNSHTYKLSRAASHNSFFLKNCLCNSLCTTTWMHVHKYAWNTLSTVNDSFFFQWRFNEIHIMNDIYFSATIVIFSYSIAECPLYFEYSLFKICKDVLLAAKRFGCLES